MCRARSYDATLPHPTTPPGAPSHDRHRRHHAPSDLPGRPLGDLAGCARGRQPGERGGARRVDLHGHARAVRGGRRGRGPCLRGHPHAAAYERGRILREISAGIKARREELGRLIATEAGKPIRDALVEVDRATLTFRLGAEEAERMTGELIPLDLMPSSTDRVGITRRFPIGPIAAISPFNFPLNLAAHKLSPAIATGNPIVLKPPSADPLTMLAVAEIIEAAGVPEGMVSILPMTRELGDRMVADERFKLLTFTGSPSVGWRMKERAGKKKVVLELGGNAGAIVDASADLDWAVKRILTGAYAYSGQICISVQRLFVHEQVWEPFMARFVEGVAALKLGDPLDPTTDVGPMVDARQAERTQRWVDEAVALGGRILAGGTADGTFFPPTVLVDVPTHAQVCSNEAFAPLVVAAPFATLDEAIARVNDSMFGLQTGVFTNDLAGAWRAFAELEVGGVIVNDIPTYRIDHMPYGGVKDSGLGREGLRWAMEDMTEIRIMVLAQPG
ncbi:MAG: aldehyde dehydrogenase family protein [Candidatus Limnocylindria bacterium]